MDATADANVWTDNHSFEEDEARTEFHRHALRWVSRCKVCGSVGYLRSGRDHATAAWSHKPLSPEYRRYLAERDADAR